MKNLYNFFDLIVSKDKMEAMIIVKKKGTKQKKLQRMKFYFFLMSLVLHMG